MPAASKTVLKTPCHDNNLPARIPVVSVIIVL
jgi:hypothetical protein